MTVAASPATPGPDPLDRFLGRRLVGLLAWLALTLAFFVPTSTVMDVSLDSSNYGSYSYFTDKGFQYGTQVIPMTGPYGFVTYGFIYSGHLFWLRALFEFALKAVLAGFILWFLRSARCHLIVRLGWLAALLAFASPLEDAHAEWLTLLVGLWLVVRTDRDEPLVLVALAGALFPLLALLKGTHLYLVLATLGLVTLHYLAERRQRRVGWLWSGFAAGFLFWWIAAWQNPLHLPAFLRGIHELASGYNRAMGVNESDQTFARGLAAAALLALALGWAMLTHRRERRALAGLLLLAGFAFVKWKHGYVRADGHVFIFFNFATIAGLTWWVFLSGVRAPVAGEDSRPVVATLLALIAFAAGLYGASDGFGPRLRWNLALLPGMFRERFTGAFTLPVAKATLDADLAARRVAYLLPEVKQRVGRGSIDLFGVEHGIIPLNDLKYRPRPMSGGTFNVYTPWLMEQNQEFLRDPDRAPEYYLVKPSTIDGRILAQDDALALRELIQRYSPVLIDQGYLLLRRQGGTVTEPTLVSRRTFRLGEKIELPALPEGRLLFASFDLAPSWRGRLRAALYKPSEVHIELAGENGSAGTHRLIPGMAAVPFLLSPLIENTTDYLHLYDRDAEKRPRAFTVTADTPADYDAELGVTFYSQPAPAAPAGVDVAEMIQFTRFPLTNVPPESIAPPESRQMILNGLLVRILFPPAEIVWKLDGTERELLFDYGFDPECYQRGTTNGADYIVEIRPPHGAPQAIFRHALHPKNHPEDRGNHHIRVPLPLLKPGSKLALRIDPGQDGDSAWDWTYVTAVQLKRGAYSPAQFPGFNRAPIQGETEHSSTVETREGRLFILHAPGSMTFQLTAADTRLSFDYGFLPGAYTGEGHTDGAVYIVELVRADDSRVTVFRRHLQPLTQEDDRGRQHVDLVLPARRAGDRLVLTIDPGPSGDNSWDWTYVTNFEVK
ncbi:MAG TPA: hypothetical protein VFJ90_07870 [Candidatus Didemnitutus sp.]|nr:hypothetical protein [Candidatus Didemnitutus sp.]